MRRTEVLTYIHYKYYPDLLRRADVFSMAVEDLVFNLRENLWIEVQPLDPDLKMDEGL